MCSGHKAIDEGVGEGGGVWLIVRFAANQQPHLDNDLHIVGPKYPSTLHGHVPYTDMYVTRTCTLHGHVPSQTYTLHRHLTWTCTVYDHVP